MVSCKGVYAVIAFIIYGVLIGLFFKFSNAGQNEDCSIDHPCVRFCSVEESDEILWAKFENTFLYKNHFNTNAECGIIRDKPKCKSMKSVSPKSRTYDFTPVSSLLIFLKYLLK